LTLIREIFLSWTSLYFSEKLKMTTSSAGIASLVVPLFAAFSAILGGQVLGRVPKKHKELVSVIYLCFLLLALSGLAAFTWTLDVVTDSTRYIGVTLMAAVAFGIEAPYTFIDGVYTLQIAGKTSPGITVGIIQSAGYAGAIAAGYVTGVLADSLGWGALLVLLSGIVVLVLITASASCIQSYRRFSAAVAPADSQ
jgi:sugar phosphate permease